MKLIQASIITFLFTSLFAGLAQATIPTYCIKADYLNSSSLLSAQFKITNTQPYQRLDYQSINQQFTSFNKTNNQFKIPPHNKEKKDTQANTLKVLAVGFLTMKLLNRSPNHKSD